jgi:hypothetical protein
MVLMSTGGGVCLATILAKLTAPLGLFIISCCSSCRTQHRHRQGSQTQQRHTRTTSALEDGPTAPAAAAAAQLGRCQNIVCLHVPCWPAQSTDLTGSLLRGSMNASLPDC